MSVTSPFHNRAHCHGMKADIMRQNRYTVALRFRASQLPLTLVTSFPHRSDPLLSRRLGSIQNKRILVVGIEGYVFKREDRKRNKTSAN